MMAHCRYPENSDTWDLVVLAHRVLSCRVSCFFFVAMMALAVLSFTPCTAYADGGVNLSNIMVTTYRNGNFESKIIDPFKHQEDVSTRPSTTYAEEQSDQNAADQSSDDDLDFPYFATLQFDKNVSFAREGIDDAFVEDNLSRIHMRKASSEDEIAIDVAAGATQEERQIIYVKLLEWLDPMEDYEIIADEGIRAANGVDVTAEKYVIGFTTSDLCSNSLTVSQNIALVALPITLGVGVVCAIVINLIQRRKSRKRHSS